MTHEIDHDSNFGHEIGGGRIVDSMLLQLELEIQTCWLRLSHRFEAEFDIRNRSDKDTYKHVEEMNIP